MKLKGFILQHLRYKAAKAGLIGPGMPTMVTYSITYLCQSQCKSCNIWKFYRKDELGLNEEEKKQFDLKKELTLNEIEKMFKSMSPIYFFNISGGEPFLRQDIDKIVGLACRYLKPNVIHVPTNAINPKGVAKKTEEILIAMKENKWDVPFTIKPSFDGVGDVHDDVRGIKGNFDRLIETINLLKELKKKYSNLYVGLGTVISKNNLKHIPEIVDYVDKLNVETYINEIAEQRAEFLNYNDDITPDAEEYKEAISHFKGMVKKNMKGRMYISRISQAIRLVYYDLVVKILREHRQVIPCYAGISNAHINAYGDVWPCCILGNKKSMGNVRDFNYDFKNLWISYQAQGVRKFIHKKNCACPLANQSYSNILLNWRSMLKAVKNMVYP